MISGGKVEMSTRPFPYWEYIGNTFGNTWEYMYSQGRWEVGNTVFPCIPVYSRVFPCIPKVFRSIYRLGGIHWEYMGIHGNTWEYMGIHVFPGVWEYMGIL
jgi:hypothetical protein